MYSKRIFLDIICNKIIKLLNNFNNYNQIGLNGRKIIEQGFTIEKMGSDFVEKYNLVLSKKVGF